MQDITNKHLGEGYYTLIYEREHRAALSLL